MRGIKILLMFHLLNLILFSQTYFSYISNTGNNATVAILISTNPKIGENPLEPGDEIGAFTPNGLCVGAVVWNNQNTALTVWGDNELTPEVDGIQVGQEIKYRIWKQSTNTEFICVSVSYSLGNGVYSVNGVYVLASLIVIVPPDVPNLLQPANHSKGISINPILKWNSSPRTDFYHLQVSLDSAFTSLLINQTQLADTFYQLNNLENYRTYFWRVRAKNCGGTTNWSNIFKFTTIIATPILISPQNGIDLVSIQPTLIWNSVNGASFYNLQVATDSIFINLVYNLTGITTTSYDLTNLNYNKIYYWRVSANDGDVTSSWSVTFNFKTIAQHLIKLPVGWNMISSNLLPKDSNIVNILNPLHSKFILIKNGYGQIYWPSGGINTINNWRFKDGYQIYMTLSDTLKIYGREIKPEVTPIQLSQNWNMISYLRNTMMSISSALGSINQNLVLVKNNYGQVYWPEYGINQIGDMLSGQGYQLYMRQASTLIYPANDVIVQKSITNHLLEPVYYKTVKRTGTNNLILLVMGEHFDNGDEIGIFTTDGKLVGSGVVEDKRAVITIWGKDEFKDGNIQGLEQSENLIVKYWQRRNREEREISEYSLFDGVFRVPVEGNLKFKQSGILILRTLGFNDIPKEYYLHQNYPNPFNSKTIISYGLPEENNVKIELYDLLGKRLKVLLNERQKSGYYKIEFNADELTSGLYFYKLTSGHFIAIKKMIIIK